MGQITGKDLIDMGFAPAPWFKPVLSEVAERGLSRSQAARLAKTHQDRLEAAERERRARERPLHAVAPAWQQNITADSEAEQAILDAVQRSFELLVRTPTVEAGAIMPLATRSIRVCTRRTSAAPSSRPSSSGRARQRCSTRSIMARDWEADAPWRRGKAQGAGR